MTTTAIERTAKQQTLHATIRAAAAQALHIHDSYGSLETLDKPGQLGLTLIEAGHTVTLTVVKRHE